MTDSVKRDAERYGIFDRIATIEKEMLMIGGVPDVDFDIRDYNEFPHVITIVHYVLDCSIDEYYQKRKIQLAQILTVLARNDLHNSGDVIEDMGEHWYIVRCTGKSWPKVGKDN